MVSSNTSYAEKFAHLKGIIAQIEDNPELRIEDLTIFIESLFDTLTSLNTTIKNKNDLCDELLSKSFDLLRRQIQIIELGFENATHIPSSSMMEKSFTELLLIINQSVNNDASKYIVIKFTDQLEGITKEWNVLSKDNKILFLIYITILAIGIGLSISASINPALKTNVLSKVCLNFADFLYNNIKA